MSNQQFVDPTNPNPNQTHLIPNRGGIVEPNQKPDMEAVDLAHPSAPNDFRQRNRPTGPHYDTPPEPGVESAGPAMFNLVQETVRALDVQSQLITKAIPLLTNRFIVEKHAGQTDANGNLDIRLFVVPQGFQFIMTRAVVEDAIHFAGTPFSAAGAWHAIIEGDKYQPGSIRDFAPNPPLSNVAILPWIYSDGNEEASIFRGGQIVSLHVVGTATLATVDIWCMLQGHLTPL